MKKSVTSLAIIFSLLLSGCWFFDPLGQALFTLGNASSITIEIDVAFNGEQIEDFVYKIDGHKNYFSSNHPLGAFTQFYFELDPQQETVDFYTEDWNHNWSVVTLTYEEYGYEKDHITIVIPLDYEIFTSVDGEDRTYTVDEASLIQFDDLMDLIPEIDRNAYIHSVTLHLAESNQIDHLSIEIISEEGPYLMVMTYRDINSTSITLPTVLR